MISVCALLFWCGTLVIGGASLGVAAAQAITAGTTDRTKENCWHSGNEEMLIDVGGDFHG